MDIDLKTLLSIISTSLGLISALLSKLYFDKINKINDNKEKLRLQTDISNIENKLKTFYIPIYFKLFILSLTKKQIKFLKEKNINNFIDIEKNIILKIHQEIINIISSCYTLDTINDISIDIIKDYINYVVTYKNLRDMNILIKPNEIGIKYPKKFLIEIENKITELHDKYETFLGRNINNNNNFLSKINIKFSNCFRFFYKSKNNITKSLTIINNNNNNKWSISNYIKNNININEINKILLDDYSSIDMIYHNIDLNKIFEKIKKNNNMLTEIDMTVSIPLEKIK